MPRACSIVGATARYQIERYSHGSHWLLSTIACLVGVAAGLGFYIAAAVSKGSALVSPAEWWHQFWCDIRACPILSVASNSLWL
jgi:hypothetical protein